ncbi:MAG: gyrase subunit A, DNA gyrase subunit A protein [Candidatus Peregrinibacteria bacterium GW2011_GWF2_33_10]|nr:MAG: gyrase subunit A, DNA gyrase subunit A protein [Candidatus Peregrinibacteria bacterium GW2011_GWF2_33_10]
MSDNENSTSSNNQANPEGTSLFNSKVINRDITEEMQTSYLDYAMSVIVARALPDVRDGLKPVHRRILYAMNEGGLKSSSKYVKSARIVGDVLGKYHPHGDSAVYDSLVRMAQDFSLRYPLINGQGNFGSIDGDNAAAMRYTEAKMEKIAEEILNDIDKETVEWMDNYDGSRKEPKVLPTRIPNLIINGSMGIAVGMATNIPPHNLTEIIDAIVYLSQNPDCSIEDLMQFVKGPDFPTGGIIYGKENLTQMYATGRGGVVIRSKSEIQELKNGKFQILIHEIPYQINKAVLVSKIADLVRDKKIQGITDIRDESNKVGIRIVIELKKDSYPNKVLNQLYKLTPLQSTFNMNMIALVGGLQPKLLNLKQVLEYFIEHRKEMITNRTKFELKITRARTHILEGLKIALDNIDDVITTIRASDTKEEAHVALVKKFSLSDKQAEAILEMRLHTLAGLERKKIDDEYTEKMNLIKELEAILADIKKVIEIMRNELDEVKEKFKDDRKTQIIPHELDKLSIKDVVPNSDMVIMLTAQNYIKRISSDTFKNQNRGGKGIIGLTTKEEDAIIICRFAKNHDEMLFFTNKGRVFKLPVYEIPEASRIAKGQAIVNILQLQDEERVTAMLNDDEKSLEKYFFMSTKRGTVKKTEISNFQNVRKTGIIAINIRQGDELKWVRQCNENNKIVLVTKNGKAVVFNQNDVRSMGRASTGVRGVRLKTDDEVVEMDIVENEEAKLLVVMENGLGKMSNISSYRLTARGAGGVKTANISPKTGKIIGAKIIESDKNPDIVLISKNGQTIRMAIQDIPSIGRATQGVHIMRLNSGDKVVSFSLINKSEKDQIQSETNTTKEEEAQVVLL